MLGDVVFRTDREHGVFKHSFLEWRVKRSIDRDDIYIALKMRPDGYAGPKGSVTNYMNFDLHAATRLRDNLSACIEHAQYLKSLEPQRADLAPRW
jgi:hypothetical protein